MDAHAVSIGIDEELMTPRRSIANLGGALAPGLRSAESPAVVPVPCRVPATDLAPLASESSRTVHAATPVEDGRAPAGTGGHPAAACRHSVATFATPRPRGPSHSPDNPPTGGRDTTRLAVHLSADF